MSEGADAAWAQLAERALKAGVRGVTADSDDLLGDPRLREQLLRPGKGKKGQGGDAGGAPPPMMMGGMGGAGGGGSAAHSSAGLSAGQAGIAGQAGMGAQALRVAPPAPTPNPAANPGSPGTGPNGIPTGLGAPPPSGLGGGLGPLGGGSGGAPGGGLLAAGSSDSDEWSYGDPILPGDPRHDGGLGPIFPSDPRYDSLVRPDGPSKSFDWRTDAGAPGAGGFEAPPPGTFGPSTPDFGRPGFDRGWEAPKPPVLDDSSMNRGGGFDPGGPDGHHGSRLTDRGITADSHGNNTGSGSTGARDPRTGSGAETLLGRDGRRGDSGMSDLDKGSRGSEGVNGPDLGSGRHGATGQDGTSGSSALLGDHGRGTDFEVQTNSLHEMAKAWAWGADTLDKSTVDMPLPTEFGLANVARDISAQLSSHTQFVTSGGNEEFGRICQTLLDTSNSYAENEDSASAVGRKVGH